MNRLPACVLVLLFATGSAVAAPVPKEPPPPAKGPNYFPCELGTRWEYECGKDFTVFEVTKVRHEKDFKIATITMSRPSAGAKSDVRYRVTKHAVYGCVRDKDAEYEMLELMFNAKAGDAWVFNAPGHFADGARSVVREPTTVEVPAGKFAVIGTSFTFRGIPAAVLQITNYYADGIGLVMTPGARAGEPPRVLKKFTPPPK